MSTLLAASASRSLSHSSSRSWPCGDVDGSPAALVAMSSMSAASSATAGGPIEYHNTGFDQHKHGSTKPM